MTSYPPQTICMHPALKLHALTPDAILPKQAGARFDLCVREAVTIPERATVIVQLGWICKLEYLHSDNRVLYCQVFSRSPMAGVEGRQGEITAEGIIDPNCEAEIALHNNTDRDVSLKKGDCVAQMIVLNAVRVAVGTY